MALAAIGLQAGGSAIDSYQKGKQADGIRAEQIAGIENQRKVQRMADASINRHISGLGASSPNAERTNAAGQYLGAIRANKENVMPRSGVMGSSRFREDEAAARSGTAGFGTKIADLLSRINAPALQRQREAEQFAALSTDVSAARRNSDREQYLTQLRTQAIPGVSGAGSFVSGIGSGLAGMKSGAGSKNSGISGPRQ